MFSRVAIFDRTMLVVCLIVLFSAAQIYWFRLANRIVTRMGSPRWRIACRTLITAGLLFVVYTFSFRILMRSMPLPRSLVAWAMGMSQLWLVFSSFAFLAVKAVHLVEWIWNRIPRMATMTPALAEAEAGGSSTPASEGTFAASPGSAAGAPAGAKPPFDGQRRKLFRYAASMAACVPFGAGLYGFASERLSYTVQRVELPIANLPRALDGLHIVQLSDIHIGDFMPASEIRRAVEMANELEPDLAVLTGDYVTGYRDPLDECVAELGRLRAHLGVWACNGNHEIYASVEERAQELFLRQGVRLLRHENAVLNWRGVPFNLLGVDYQGEIHRLSGRVPMLTGVEGLLRRDMPNILLSHNPNSFYRAAELGIELTLAGHTHGGQIQIEIIDRSWSPARFITSFIAGAYHLPLQTTTPYLVGKQACLYVNRGLGTIGIPARLGSKPEISSLILRSA